MPQMLRLKYCCLLLYYINILNCVYIITETWISLNTPQYHIYYDIWPNITLHKNPGMQSNRTPSGYRWSSITKKLKYSITVFNNYKLINSPSPFSYRTFILLYFCVFMEIRFLRFDFISCLQVCIGIECSYKRLSRAHNCYAWVASA